MRRRAREITGVLARHGLGYVLDALRLGWLVPFHHGVLGHPRRSVPYTKPEHVRMALEDLGPTFVKLGQLLSTRADLLPPAYQAELARLQDAAPPEAPGTVERILAAELGRPPDTVFAAIDPVPLAAASIGQAHAATLLDGTPVVVKVRRPGALARIAVDLALLERAAAALTRHWAIARRLALGDLVAELARTLRAELDYRREAANLERFAADFAADPGVHIPRLYREATTEQAITLERVTGIKVSDLAALDAAGVDRPALARRLMDVVLRMVFEHGFFHADPHPGNLFLEAGGRLGIIDFGMVGAFDEERTRQLGNLFLATAARDADTLAANLLTLGAATGPVDSARLAADLADLLTRFVAVPFEELRFGPLLQAEFAVVRRHHLRLPPELALLARTAAITEGLAGLLDPHFQPLAAFQPYAARLLVSRPAPPPSPARVPTHRIAAGDLVSPGAATLSRHHGRMRRWLVPTGAVVGMTTIVLRIQRRRRPTRGPAGQSGRWLPFERARCRRFARKSRYRAASAKRTSSQNQ